MESEFRIELFKRAQPEWLRKLITDGSIKVDVHLNSRKFFILTGNKYFYRAINIHKIEYADWDVCTRLQSSG